MRELAEKMLGSTLVTVQTGPEGKQVNRLYVEQGIDIDAGALPVDRARPGPGSEHGDGVDRGGTEIEEVAAETPEKIVRQSIDPAFGLLGFEAARVADALGLTGPPTATASPSSRPSPSSPSSSTPTWWRSTRWW